MISPSLPMNCVPELFLKNAKPISLNIFHTSHFPFMVAEPKLFRYVDDEREALEKLLARGGAPWKVWED